MAHGAIPLSERGDRQASALAATLNIKPSQVLVSRMVRTHQTAAPFCARYGVVAQQDARLDEFSVVDPELIAGLDGNGRKPFVRTYWNDPDPHRRQGSNADTFVEFASRVRAFAGAMAELPPSTVIFGHGIWLGMLHWLLQGKDTSSAEDMIAFRQFQQALPMPNCAAFRVTRNRNEWRIRAELPLSPSISAEGPS